MDDHKRASFRCVDVAGVRCPCCNPFTSKQLRRRVRAVLKRELRDEVLRLRPGHGGDREIAGS